MKPEDDAARIAVDLAVVLESAGIPYAVGGALALGPWGVPRGTKDVDLNVFVGESRFEEFLSVLERAGCQVDREKCLRQAREGDTVVLAKDDMRVDVFVPTIPFYAAAEKTVKLAPIYGRQVRVLSAEALCVFKLLFFRGKDLVDLELLVAVQGPALDHAWIRRWMVDMFGEADERVLKWDEIVRVHGPQTR